MTQAQDLLALAERVERLTGPDREVDARIYCALVGVRYKGHFDAYGCVGETQVEFTEPPQRRRCVTGNARWPHARSYTASLDAAMSLVPEGWGFLLTVCDDLSVWGSGCFPVDSAPADSAKAATPALALTAAALRARALAHASKGGGE